MRKNFYKTSLLLAVMGCFLSTHLSQASCVAAYDKKVTAIKDRQNLRSWITGPAGAAAGFGAAVLVTYDFSILPIIGAAAFAYTAEEIAKIRENRLSHIASVIKDSYGSEITEDLRKETWAMSKKMKEQLSVEELASAVAKLDATDSFCPRGKAISLRAFRKLIKNEIDPTVPQPE